MAFVSLGGDGSTRPTFFEMVAAEQLIPSLKSATTYTLSVLAQRRPFLQRLLRFEDELAALFSGALDCLSLDSSSASFSESLYGLRRTAEATGEPGDSSEGARQPLRRTQINRALILLVAIPYIHAKLEAFYVRHQPRQEALPGLGAFQRRRRQAAAAAAAITAGTLVAPETLRQRLRRQALWLFVQAYPWLHATVEGCKFGYQLLYLLEASPYYSPALAVLRQRVVRVSGTDLSDAERRTAAARGRELAAVRSAGPLLLRLLRAAGLQACYVLADHTRNALILSVFAFKLMEWWYTQAEEKLGGGAALPPPPPPPAPRPHPDGVPLPEDPAICALCEQLRTNPAMVEVSGYTFCYPCVFRHVSEHSRCPVTLFPATLDNVRRLYQGA